MNKKIWGYFVLFKFVLLILMLFLFAFFLMEEERRPKSMDKKDKIGYTDP